MQNNLLERMKEKISPIYYLEKGQALLFVVIAMTIALALGIGAAVRTISSLSRTTRTDTASRALAAAEGGVERFLALSTQELEDASDAASLGSCPVGTYDESSASCLIEFDVTQDIIVSQAFVTVERYEPDYYPFSLESGKVKEINLYDIVTRQFYDSSRVEICWTAFTPSELIYTSYNEEGIQANGGLSGINSPSNPYQSEGFENADAGNAEYANCKIVQIDSTGVNDIFGLRIRSLGGNIDVGIYPLDGEKLPLQGYIINSIGRIQQDTGVTASRNVKVVRTLPYLPGGFDFALFTEGSISK